jgi:hypothetical protein
MAALDTGTARRVKQAVERFTSTGAGNVKRLQGIVPPEYGLRVGDIGFASNRITRPFAFSASATAAKRTAEMLYRVYLPIRMSDRRRESAL